MRYRGSALAGIAGLLVIAGTAAGCAASAAPASHRASSASSKKTASPSASAPAGTAASGCVAVHIIVARASTEPPGDGIIGSLATLIQHAVKTPVTQEAIVYPATLSNYPSSVGLGDAAMKTALTTDAANCPQERFVLLGYSQGAQVVGDVLGGGGGPGLAAATPPVSAALAAKVLAVIQMGDPRRMPGLSLDAGTDPAAMGLFPRLPSQTLAPFASKIQSYCDIGDPFCARGKNLAAHLDYTFKYNTAALAFVVGKLHAAGIQ
jgi:acetylxylan esterase